jgi:ABC-type enterobactin transport system permease subunit
MNAERRFNGSGRQLFGWIGLICLGLIIPVKAVRFVDESAAGTLLVGIAPSLLGPAGLFFVLLSGPGKASRLTRPQFALLVAAIALGLEFAQLLPRPGILARVHYTFDWLDVLASLGSVGGSYLVAFIMTKKKAA